MFRSKRYQIQNEISSGGMGKIYKTIDLELDRVVALKMTKSKSIPYELKKRFLIEAQALAKLNHPNIVKVYDIWVEGEKGCIAMQFIQGETLAKHISKKSFSVLESLKIIQKIALAIEYTHQNNIIHRDLKPNNLMIEEETCQPFVIDFGLAKNLETEAITKKGDILGTPRYMAPEQAKGNNKEIFAGTDIYALGCILYELLSGHSVVKGKTQANILFEIINKEPVSLSKHNPKLALDLIAICHKAIEKEPAKRYQSAKAFIQDIEKFLNGEIVFSYSETIWSLLRRKVKKYALEAKIAISLIFITLTFFVVAEFWQIYKQQKKIKQHLENAQRFLTSLPSSKRWDKNFLNSRYKKIFSAFSKATFVLNRALEEFPSNKKIKQKLFQVQKDMGLRAMISQNYLLSYVAFKRCEKLGYTQEAKKLFLALSKHKKKKQQNQKQKLKNIMDRAKTPIEKEILDRYVFTIAHMQEYQTIKQLLNYTKSPFFQQRQIAIRALGVQGNIKIKNIDIVKHLLLSLQKTDPKKYPQEILDIIWALSLLRDSRATIPVWEKRYKLGFKFWYKTKIADHLLPIPKIKPKTAWEFFQRAMIKQDKRKLLDAIADFTKAIDIDAKFAKAYHNRGRAHLGLKQQQKDFQEAIADFSKAIEIDPRCFGAYRDRGYAYQLEGNDKTALENFKEAIAVNPDSIRTLLFRSRSYRSLGMFSLAMADLNRILNLDPKNWIALYDRSLLFRKQGNIKKAAKNYSQMVLLYPQSYRVYKARAHFFAEQNQTMKAIRDFSQSIYLNPENITSYYHRALLRAKQGDIPGAIADYSYVIKSNPKTHVYKHRAELFEKQGKIKEAISDYSHTIRFKHPGLYDAYSQRAAIYQKQQNIAKAIADYSQMIELNPKNSIVYKLRGDLFEKQGNLNKASADYSKAIKLNHPNLHKLYRLRAFLRRKQKDIKGAIADYSQMIKLKPGKAGAYIFRAALREKRGRRSKAIWDYSQAIRLQHPRLYTIYKRRAILFTKQGNLRGAIADYSKIIEHDPKNSRAYVFRGCLFDKTRQYTKAQADFVKAIDIAPKNAIAYYYRGIFYKKQNKIEEAITDLKMFLKLAAKTNKHYSKAEQIVKNQKPK